MPSLYTVSVVPMIQYLGSLKDLLQKGEEFCKSRGTDPKNLLASRLHVTMFPLTFQVQMCCNMAKLLTTRVANQEAESLPDNEKSFEELYARIDKITELLKSLKPDCMDEAEKANKDITVKTPLTGFTLNTVDYVTLYAIPNFHFHLTTVYTILRSQGVDIGKLDYACFETDPSQRQKPGA